MKSANTTSWQDSLFYFCRAVITIWYLFFLAIDSSMLYDFFTNPSLVAELNQGQYTGWDYRSAAHYFISSAFTVFWYASGLLMMYTGKGIFNKRTLSYAHMTISVIMQIVV